jgi:hypothetical protein
MAINSSLKRFAIIPIALGFLSTGWIFAQGQGANNSEATITNTGTTDIEGYVITVSRSGDATCKWRTANSSRQEFSDDTIRDESLRAKIPMPIVNKLFSDLDAVKSVSNLPDEPHAKNDTESITYVTYRGQTSPDLSSSGNAKKSALYDDVVQISLAFASKEDSDDIAPATPALTTRTITLADNNKTIELKVGQTIILDLGSNCDWAIAGMDQGLFDQQPSSGEKKTSARTYRVVAAGIMMLRLIGSPDCATEKSSDRTTIQEFQVAVFITQ